MYNKQLKILFNYKVALISLKSMNMINLWIGIFNVNKFVLLMVKKIQNLI